MHPSVSGLGLGKAVSGCGGGYRLPQPQSTHPLGIFPSSSLKPELEKNKNKAVPYNRSSRLGL